MRICVVGAGISGSIAARLLAADGHAVVLAERAAEPRAEGAGIVLTDAAVRHLERAGVRLAANRLPAGVRIVARGDRQLLGSGPRVSLRRESLLDALLDGLDRAVDVRWGSAVSGVRTTGDGASVLVGEAVEHFDLIVGADGLRSAVRRAIRPDAGLRASGQVCWRAILDGHVTTEATEWWGGGIRIGSIPLPSSSTYAYVVATGALGMPLPASGVATGAHAATLDAMAGMPIELVLVRELVEVERTVWGAGCVALVGDASHAMLPNLGAGAAMGIADASALAAILRRGGRDAAAGLRHSRGPATAVLRRTSRALGRLAHPAAGTRA